MITQFLGLSKIELNTQNKNYVLVSQTIHKKIKR